MSYKQYSIIPSASRGATIGVVTEIMKTTSSAYPTRLTPAQETRAKGYYPKRIVTSSIISSSFTGLGLYKLTEAEANLIKTDPLISKVIFINTASALESEVTASSIPSRNYRFFQDDKPSLNADKANLSSWVNYYHSLPKEEAYSGSFGQKTYEMFGGGYDADGRRDDLSSFTLPGDVNYSLDGTGVDVVIWEGNQGINHNHAELYGKDGQNRMNFVNWAEYDDAGYLGGDHNYPDNFYANISHSIYSGTPWSSIPHNQQTLMAAVGLTSGFAKGSDIIRLPSSISNSGGLTNRIVNFLNILIKYNATKPINPKTGKRNRTVCSISFGNTTTRLFPHSQAEPSTRRVSGSFNFSHHGADKGIRIEGAEVFYADSVGSSSAYKSDKIFISGSEISIDNDVTINERPKSADIYYYTGGLEGLVDVMNSNLNATGSPASEVGWTASFNSTTLQITSSTNERVGPVRIYTGSITDFIHVGSESPSHSSTSPRGGSLQITFDEPDPSYITHISKIVVKGNLIYTGSDYKHSNGILNANSGYSLNFPTDHYGIDKGMNTDHMKNFNFQQWVGGLGLTSTFTIEEAFKEAANAGIIFVIAAGNTSKGLQISMVSSSLEENNLYDPSLFSEDLGNTYIEYDIEYRGRLGLGYDVSPPEGPIPPHTKLHLGLPPIFCCNYQGIQAGGLALNRWYIEDEQNSFPATIPPLNTGSEGIQGRITADCHKKNYGAAVSAYVGNGSYAYGGTLSTNKYSYLSPSSSFHNSINFDQTKISASYSQPFMENALGNSLKDSSGNIDFFQEMTAMPKYGGTSFSAPYLAGIIACYLEANPDASFIDVRNWVHNTGNKVLTHVASPSDKFLHEGQYITSSVHPAYFESIFLASGGVDLGGRNGNIAHFPYNSPIRGKLSNITMSRS